MKKEIVLITGLLSAILLIVFLSFNNINNKIEPNKEEKPNNEETSTNEEEKPNNETTDKNEEEKPTPREEVKIYNLKTDGIEKILNCDTYKCITNIDSFGQLILTRKAESLDESTITLNDVILKENQYHYIADIKLINSLLYIKFKIGYDISGTSFGVYKTDATPIVFYEVNDKSNNLPDKFGAYITYDVKVSDETIEFVSNNVGHGYLIDSDTDICDKDAWMKLPLKGETIVSKKYTITYLGDFKYSNPIIKNYETINDMYKLFCE